MKERSEIGRFLAKWRVDKQMSQQETAALLGVSPACLSAVERGEKGVGAEFILKVMSLPRLSSDDKWELAGMYWSLL